MFKLKDYKQSRLNKFAKRNYKNWTKPESLMNGWLSTWGIKHSNQVVIDNYIVDILIHETKTIVELDGIQHRDNIRYDTKRTFDLVNLGYNLIRFDNSEMKDIKGVKEKLLDHLINSYVKRPVYS